MNGVASVLPLASALPTLLFVGMVMAAVVGVMALVSRKDIYDEIGGGGLSMEHEESASERASGDEVAREVDFHSESEDPAIARAERELEIRQLLEARSARAVRQGGEPLDVEAELARLLALDEVPPTAGEEAGTAQERERELEIRQMLEARSARRVKKGGEPLDVEGELRRLLRGAEDQV